MEPRDTGISLVLVTRNRESDLARTLETLKGALCPCPWEIILVDNASDTDMSRVCKASGLANLRFFRTEENLGPPRRPELRRIPGPVRISGISG